MCSNGRQVRARGSLQLKDVLKGNEVFPQENVLLHQGERRTLHQPQVLRYLPIRTIQGLHQALQIRRMQVC